MPASRTPWLTAVAPLLAIAVVATSLAWEHLHGGISSHHLLNRPDLPAISNAWGLIVLPALGAIAGGVVAVRVDRGRGTLAGALRAATGALLAGAALSGAFRAGLESLTFALFVSSLAAGLVLRTYRAEYAFGFALGMALVFGTVLPTLVAAVAAALSAVVHFVVYPPLGWAWRRLRA